MVIKKIQKVLKQRIILKYQKCSRIKDKEILLEAKHGGEVNGNIFYIIKELCENKAYADFKIYLSYNSKSKSKTKKKLIEHKLNRVKLLKVNSFKYYKKLSTCKFIVNDTTFLPFFIKREGQVYLNTWHGTPLKTLGKQVKNDFYNMGNVQKNFIVADYLLCPNEFTMDKIVEDYMIENLSEAKILLTGYPRNTEFFNKNNRERIKKNLNLYDKEIIAYMPTWRGTIYKQDSEEQETNIRLFLGQMEKLLKDNQVMYVNIHPIAKASVSYENYTKVRPFPDEYETYEFLNVCDKLITDYSSVIFDFAITRKKIILYAYDKEKYIEDRGLYIPLDELPFPKVNDVKELIREINSKKDYEDNEFINRFCKYDNEKVTSQLCEKIFLRKDVDIEERNLNKNGKENILIYAGALAKNGLTSSIKSLLQNIDKNKRNYYILVDSEQMKKNYKELLNISKEIKYIPYTRNMNHTIISSFFKLLFKNKIISANKYIKHVGEIYKYEIKRILGNTKYSTVIQFSGYSTDEILMFSIFDCTRIIYVHNDMNEEIQLRKNQRRDVLKYAYNEYDKVALVTDDLIDSTAKFTNGNIKNMSVVNNIINYKKIIKEATNEIEFDLDTEINISIERLKEILNNANKKKFITIGRFSPEKGHIRLIDAFYRLWKKNKNIYLIIIGGHGKLYDKTLNYIEQLECKNNIIIIKSISNPYTILKKCNYFVLPSLYEGFGLVIAEADILGLPIITTDVVGPRGFMQKNSGKMVESSEEGIYKGLEMLLKNKIKPMKIDYEQYNKNAIEQFEKLFK